MIIIILIQYMIRSVKNHDTYVPSVKPSARWVIRGSSELYWIIGIYRTFFSSIPFIIIFALLFDIPPTVSSSHCGNEWSYCCSQIRGDTAGSLSPPPSSLRFEPCFSVTREKTSAPSFPRRLAPNALSSPYSWLMGRSSAPEVIAFRIPFDWYVCG